jgi:hypothetical protein
MSALDSTQPWYVRCVKPNLEKSSSKWNDALVGRRGLKNVCDSFDLACVGCRSIDVCRHVGNYSHSSTWLSGNGLSKTKTNMLLLICFCVCVCVCVCADENVGRRVCVALWCVGRWQRGRGCVGKDRCITRRMDGNSNSSMILSRKIPTTTTTTSIAWQKQAVSEARRGHTSRNGAQRCASGRRHAHSGGVARRGGQGSLRSAPTCCHSHGGVATRCCMLVLLFVLLLLLMKTM